MSYYCKDNSGHPSYNTDRITWRDEERSDSQEEHSVFEQIIIKLGCSICVGTSDGVTNKRTYSVIK